mmetsp:Transcript_17415/g.38131  ORF Transcript_17415/g.38131 Transcript_17415/m.38131 type:complete len:165 (+) Transcript_17415:271-765(+)
MYRVTEQFEFHLGLDDGKIELKWLKRNAREWTWTEYNQFWKKSVLCLKHLGIEMRWASQAFIAHDNDMTSVMKTLQSITQQNNVIAQQHNALLTEVVGLCKAHNARVSPPVTTGALDDMSASTDILEWFTDMSTATSPTAFLSLTSLQPATVSLKDATPSPSSI